MSDEGEVRVHHYRTGLHWQGTTAVGYDAYDRTHTVWAHPDIGTTTLSGDAAFLGRDDLLNPERLLVLAASSCQLLSFLAVAARARIDVVAYVDDAVGEMPERGSDPASIETIVLRPRIRLRDEVPLERALRLVELAHQECYVANSLRTEVTVEPTFPVGGRDE
jgi:organic hydroperoxide reductase OsmC/OhrA